MENLLSTIAIIGIYIDIDYNWDPILLYILDLEFNLLKYIKCQDDEAPQGNSGWQIYEIFDSLII